MNRGLKEKAKIISLNVEEKVGTYININENDANLHFVVNLNTYSDDFPLDLSLIYALSEKESSSFFGKGFKLNLYKKIENLIDCFSVTNADGSIDLYRDTNKFYNPETQLYVYEDVPIDHEEQFRSIYNDNGFTSLFHLDSDYPSRINAFNKRIRLELSGSPKTIRFNNGNFVELYSQNDLVNEIYFIKRGVRLVKIIIEYDSDSMIKQIIYLNANETLMDRYQFEFLSDQITVKNVISNYRLRFNINYDRVQSFVDGYDDSFTNGHLTRIDYSNKKTIIFNYKEKASFTVFDANDTPLYDFDNEGNICGYSFDLNTKKIKENTGVLNLDKWANIIDNNLLNFFSSGINVEEKVLNDSIYRHLIKGKTFYLRGTGTLTKEIELDGLSKDDLMLVLFAKHSSYFTSNDYATISLSVDDITKTKRIKDTSSADFDFVYLGFTASKSFKKVKIEIKIYGTTSIEVGELKLIHTKFGSFYEYDQKGNLTSRGSGSYSESYSYNSKNELISSMSSNSSLIGITYDDNGNVKTTYNSYGLITNYGYDQNFKNKMISMTVQNKEGDTKYAIFNSYNKEGQICETRDERYIPTYFDEYDPLGNLKKVRNSLQEITKFDYNLDESLKLLELSKDNKKATINYEYDIKKRNTNLITPSNSRYSFVYDDYDNLVKVLLDNNVIYKYEYDVIDGSLLKVFYGENGNYYEFNYSDDLLTEIYFGDGLNNKTQKYKFVYDRFKRVKEVLNENNESLKNIEYYEDDSLKALTTRGTRIDYQYDNLNNVINKKIEHDNFKVFTTYDSLSRSKGSHLESISSSLNFFNSYFGDFEIDANLKYNNEIIKPYNNENQYLNLKKEGIIPYINVGKNNNLSYQLKSFGFNDQPCGHICFWFKLNKESYSRNKKTYLFSVTTSASNCYDSLRAYLYNGGIVFEGYDNKGNQALEFRFDDVILEDGWNFFGLNFINREEGQGYKDESEYELLINGWTKTIQKSNPRIYIDCNPKPIIRIGHLFSNNKESAFTEMKVACLLLGHRYVSAEGLYKFYRLTKDYIVENDLIDKKNSLVDFSETNLLSINQNILNKFEIYPLKNSLNSLNGKRPIAFDSRNLTNYDRDKTFNFNNLIKEYAYVADGEDLKYDFNIDSAGTIAFKIFTDAKNEKQYILEGIDSSNHSIGLYRDENEKLIFSLNGRTINTNLILTRNEWHNLAISFKGTRGSSSLRSLYLDIRICLDDKIWQNSYSVDSYFGKLIFSIGRKNSPRDESHSFGTYRNYFPLFGLIQMLSTRNAYCEYSTIEELFESFKVTHKRNEFDEFGMLKKSDIVFKNKRILSRTYEYLNSKFKPTYKAYLVEKENFAMSDNERAISYAYDDLGRLLAVNYFKEQTHNYEYDYRGYLIRDNNLRIEYDNNGNILKKGDVSYTYDPVIKDRLIKVGNETIEYDANNPLIPTKYLDKRLKFEGKRLKEVTKNNKTSYFYYDEEGYLIKKIDGNGKVTSFIYENGNLLYLKKDNDEFDFLYDENNLLYGFILNKSNIYYYLRDIFNNILGILDCQGEVIVSYEYDAFGKIINTEDLSSIQLGILNPFKFKGYYYDEEIGLYFLLSRYYDSEIGRFISSDNVNYLDSNSINGLNLYVYCNNDPVNLCDPSGHIAITTAIILVLIGIGAFAGFGAVAYVDCTDDGKIFNASIGWKTYVGGTLLGGAIGGTIGYFLAPGIAALLSSTATIGGGLAFTGIGGTIGGAIAASSIGELALAGVGALTGGISFGANVMFAKGFGPRMGHNQYENKQFKQLCNKHHLTKDEARILHDYISHQNLSYHEIEQIIFELFRK